MKNTLEDVNDIINEYMEFGKAEIEEKDIQSLLYWICEREHSSCNESCPIYKDILTEQQKKNSNCPYFKNGDRMLKGLRGQKFHTIRIDGEDKIVTEEEYKSIC